MKNYIVNISVQINAPVNKVWEALTKPELVKQYFFGTTVDSDWKVGSPIFFRGSWDGKSYEDKGKILEVTPLKHLAYTYWSSFSGLADIPENYKTVIFDLDGYGDQTVLMLTQDNNVDEKSKEHSEQNWKMVLDGLKKLVEPPLNQQPDLGVQEIF
jgi:uncharacterized protein YndB with AHSA1/START domain